MMILPAIDIKDGKVVRLSQGDYGKVTRYAEDPLAQAMRFAAQGAQWVHVVDLDAAKAGKPVNDAVIRQIARTTGLQVQVGGGIRTLSMARDYLEGGVARVVVGTRAVRDPDFLKDLSGNFPGRVALGLDTKGGLIAVQGWTQTTGDTLEGFLQSAPLQGVACLIVTDIARDGMLTGPNLEALKKALQLSPIPVIASGGVSSLQDLQSLKGLNDPKLWGVITGKALYEGRFTLEEALQC